jgi:hypothetical protein
MTTAYVRAPFSGCISGKAVYCVADEPGEHCCNCDDSCNGSGGTHWTCGGGSNPIDICGTAGSSIYLRVNYPTVRCVQVWVAFPCCSGCADKYRRTVKVDLYSQPNMVGYIGTIVFAHVDNPTVLDGQMFNLTSSSLKLGYVPSGSCGNCFTGPHVHMERYGGSTASLCCCSSVTTSSNIYSWNF